MKKSSRQQSIDNSSSLAAETDPERQEREWVLRLAEETGLTPSLTQQKPKLKPTRKDLRDLAKDSSEASLGSSAPLIAKDEEEMLCITKQKDLPKMFFSMLSHFGPRILALPTAQALLQKWYQERFDDTEAARSLARVGEALSFVVQGNKRKERTVEEAKRERQKSRHKAGTKRNQKQTAQRLVEEIRKQEDWYRKAGKTAEQAKKEAKQYVLNEWKATSRAKDKPVIIAIVKDILCNN